MERYNRNYGDLISPEEQNILLSKKCAVLGAGGNGGYTIEFLARLGVKEIYIWDGDCFEVSNLNRQIYCTEETLGSNKATVAMLKAKEVNSNIKIQAFPRYVGEKYNEDFNLLLNVDIIFDCCDYMQYPKMVSNMLIEILKQNPSIGITYSANTDIGGFNSIHTQKTLNMYIDLQRENLNSWDKTNNKIFGQPAYMCAITAANDVAAAVKFLCQQKYDLTGEIYNFDLYHFKSFKEDKYGII